MPGADELMLRIYEAMAQKGRGAVLGGECT
jgi:hypothetical protein